MESFGKLGLADLIGAALFILLLAGIVIWISPLPGMIVVTFCLMTAAALHTCRPADDG